MSGLKGITACLVGGLDSSTCHAVSLPLCASLGVLVSLPRRGCVRRLGGGRGVACWLCVNSSLLPRGLSLIEGGLPCR